MDCVIVGVPPPIINWIHNGQNVANSSERMVFLNGSLFIKSLAHNDGGQYSCSGTNNKGSIASSDIFLHIACKYI